MPAHDSDQLRWKRTHIIDASAHAVPRIFRVVRHEGVDLLNQTQPDRNTAVSSDASSGRALAPSPLEGRAAKFGQPVVVLARQSTVGTMGGGPEGVGGVSTEDGSSVGSCFRA